MEKKKKIIIIVVVVVLIGLFFLPGIIFSISGPRPGMGQPITLTPESNLEKTSVEKKIALFNYNSWNSTVSSSYLPNNYFGDYSILPGLSGEFVIRSWSNDIWNASEIFTYFLIPRKQLGILNSQFNKTYIDKNYFGLYVVNQIYTTPAFEDDTSRPQVFYVFQYPQYLKKFFDDYNSYVEHVNNDTNPYTPQLSNFTAEEFLFHFFVNQSAVATPANFYLYILVDLFNDEDVRMGNNELILDLEGVSNYTVRIGFDEMGLSSYIIFLDENNMPFYGITTDYSNMRWIVWLILGIIIIAIVAVVSYIIIKRVKRNKKFKESLERMES